MQAHRNTVEATNSEWEALTAAFEHKMTLLRAECNKISREHEELKREQDGLVELHGGADVEDTDLLEINAGGTLIKVKRGALTQLKGTRLEALFSGRWESQLQLDDQGRIFLDVNPGCFQSIVDFLNELKISSPESPPELPSIEKDDEVFLDYLLAFFGLYDLESFPNEVPATKRRLAKRVAAATVNKETQKSDAHPQLRVTFDEFPRKLEHALEAEQQSLVVARDELDKMKRAFRQEKKFIDFFMGDTAEIVKLDVSGRPLSVKRSTLILCRDSVLAKQFSDEVWSQRKTGEVLSVKEWGVEQVLSWARDLDGVLEETVVSLSKHNVNGAELLAMDREDFKEIGIVRTGALAMLAKAVKDLRSGSHSGVSFIEHSQYCFGKIIDQLRLRAMLGFMDELLPPPYVRESEKKRFKRTVDFFFPGEMSGFIFTRGLDSSIISFEQSQHIREWLEEDNVGGDLELLYRASRDGWEASQFHTRCDYQGATITVIQSKGGFVFGGFADKAWDMNVNGHTQSLKAFLFALRSYSGMGPTKMRQVNSPYALYSSKSCGPSFGGKRVNGVTCTEKDKVGTCVQYGREVVYDLYVHNHANANARSYTSIGQGYQRPPKQNGQTFLTGDKYFTAAEVEVFRIL